MMNLTQGVNVVAVTLKEKGNHPSPFGVRLTSKATRQASYFVAIDDSPFPERYNRLTFDIGLLAPGQYDYAILTVTSPEVTLETGLAVVAGITPLPTQFAAGAAITTWKG